MRVWIIFRERLAPADVHIRGRRLTRSGEEEHCAYGLEAFNETVEYLATGNISFILWE